MNARQTSALIRAHYREFRKHPEIKACHALNAARQIVSGAHWVGLADIFGTLRYEALHRSRYNTEVNWYKG